MIVASAVQTASSPFPRDGVYPHSLDSIESLDDIAFHVLDIGTGKICEKKVLTADYTYLTGHAGVHLFNDTLAVLSIQNQCVYLFRVLATGVLEEYKTIGYHKDDADQAVVDEMLDAEDRMVADSRVKKRKRNQYRQISFEQMRAARPREDTRLSGIKQSLMSFLYKRARASGDPAQMNHFCTSCFNLV